MWMIFASGFLAIALTNADNKANMAFDATNPPDAIPDFDGKLPTAKELLEMLDSMSGLSDEEKSTLRENLLKNLQGDHVPETMPGNDLTMQTMVLLSLLSIVVLIFVLCTNSDQNMAQNILDSLRDKGVLSSSAQEKLLNLIPDNTKEKLFNIFQRYQELNDEEKQQFVHEVVGKFKQVLEDKMNNYSSLYTYLFHSYLIFIFAVLFVVFILVFFVYKLFKCLSDRQTKREEKKKTKQMKKKK